MTQVRVQIHGVRGTIVADTLVSTLQGWLRLLRALDLTSRRGEGRPGQWRVGDVWNGSISVVLEPSADVPVEVPTRLIEGLTVLEERPELPPWFSESAIEIVQKMGKVLRDPGVSGLGIAALTSNGQEKEARLTPVVVEHAKEAFQGEDEASGSVAGILDVVNLRRGRRTVSLYDADERHAVRCTFPEELFETVRDYLGSTVRATGTVARNRVGQIASVKVESLDRIKESGPAPTVAELTGIAPWYTGERTAVEHQKWTRGA